MTYKNPDWWCVIDWSHHCPLTENAVIKVLDITVLLPIRCQLLWTRQDGICTILYHINIVDHCINRRICGRKCLNFSKVHEKIITYIYLQYFHNPFVKKLVKIQFFMLTKGKVSFALVALVAWEQQMPHPLNLTGGGVVPNLNLLLWYRLLK